MPIMTALSLTEVEELRGDARDFETHANELKTLTDSMFVLVDGTNSLWRGEAQQAYQRQFDGLRDEMEHLYNQVKEYYDDLMEIAGNYERAERENTSTSQQLSSSIPLS